MAPALLTCQLLILLLPIEGTKGLHLQSPLRFDPVIFQLKSGLSQHFTSFQQILEIDKETDTSGPYFWNFYFDSCVRQLEFTNYFVPNLHMIEVVIHVCCPMSRLTLCFTKRQISLLNHCSLGFSAWVRRSEVVNRPCTHVLIQSLSISTPSIGRKLLARKIKLGPSAFFQLFAASSPIVSQGLFLGHMFC